MSDFHCEVVRLKDVQKHPNADTLSIASANGHPVIFRTGDYAEGDLAVYVPVDAIVPDTDEWKFLAGHRRIRAKRLRGVFSMGVLSKPQPGMEEGQDVRELMQIEKYEPPEPLTMGGDNEKDPGFLPVYTDIEGYRRWASKNIFQLGEEVVLTEKIHGANGRFLYRDGRLWIGSRTCIKKQDPNNLWWKVALALELENRLKDVENIVVYGEVYGQVQDLKYGKSGCDLILFDALDSRNREYLHHDDFLHLAKQLNLPVVPQLFRGPWSTDLLTMAEGESNVPGASNIREGFVMKPTKERYHLELGRTILKYVGESYLTRKGG